MRIDRLRMTIASFSRGCSDAEAGQNRGMYFTSEPALGKHSRTLVSPPGRDMYQIILIIENGGNFTPTRCRATRRRETVFAEWHSELQCVFAAYNNTATILVFGDNGCCFNGSPIATGSQPKPPSPHDFPVRVNSNRDLFLSPTLSRTDPLDGKKKDTARCARNVKILKCETAK